MRKAILAAMLIAVLIVPASAQQESIVEAAKKARAQRKGLTKGPVFTNDNIESVRGMVNVVGPAVAPSDTAKKAEGEEKTEADKAPAKDVAPGAKDEAYWRKRFAEARKALAEAEKEADILQRERNLLEQQYYSDPNTALRQQYSRKDVDDLKRKIEEKKAEIAMLKQAISDLEDELRAAGGDPGWAR